MRYAWPRSANFSVVGVRYLASGSLSDTYCKHIISALAHQKQRDCDGPGGHYPDLDQDLWALETTAATPC